MNGARCLNTSKWACGHPEKHREAAYKGWATRRHPERAYYHVDREQRIASHVLGNRVSQAHEHPEHKGVTRFYSAGQYWEMDNKDWKMMLKSGRAGYDAEIAAIKRQHREAEKEKRARERRRYSAVEIRHQLAEQAAYDKEVARERKRQHADAVKAIKRAGGIRPYRPNSAGKIPELEEWRGLPAQLRTRDQRRGWSMDEAREIINREVPGLNLESDSDMIAYFANEKQYRAEQARKRRMSA